MAVDQPNGVHVPQMPHTALRWCGGGGGASHTQGPLSRLLFVNH